MNQFELLWNKYPKRVGKKEALYYYNEAIKKGETFDTIVQGLDNCIEYLKNEDIPDITIKNGSNWFKGECLDDDYELVIITMTFHFRHPPGDSSFYLNKFTYRPAT